MGLDRLTFGYGSLFMQGHHGIHVWAARLEGGADVSTKADDRYARGWVRAAFLTFELRRTGAWREAHRSSLSSPVPAVGAGFTPVGGDGAFALGTLRPANERNRASKRGNAVGSDLCGRHDQRVAAREGRATVVDRSPPPELRKEEQPRPPVASSHPRATCRLGRPRAWPSTGARPPRKAAGPHSDRARKAAYAKR